MSESQVSLLSLERESLEVEREERERYKTDSLLLYIQKEWGTLYSVSQLAFKIHKISISCHFFIITTINTKYQINKIK